MKTKDQILLEKVYSKMVLKEAFNLTLKYLSENKPAVWDDYLDLRDVKHDIDLSFLEECKGNIYAAEATSLDLRNLKKCGGFIKAFTATHLDLSSLQTCGGYIDAGKATDLDLRNLETCGGDIYAYEATHLDLRNFKEFENEKGRYEKYNIFAYEAKTIIIPEEFKSRLKGVKNTCKISTTEEELYKTGFEPEKMLDSQQSEKLGGLFFNRNEN